MPDITHSPSEEPNIDKVLAQAAKEGRYLQIIEEHNAEEVQELVNQKIDEIRELQKEHTSQLEEETLHQFTSHQGLGVLYHLAETDPTHTKLIITTALLLETLHIRVSSLEGTSKDEIKAAHDLHFDTEGKGTVDRIAALRTEIEDLVQSYHFRLERALKEAGFHGEQISQFDQEDLTQQLNQVTGLHLTPTNHRQAALNEVLAEEKGLEPEEDLAEEEAEPQPETETSGGGDDGGEVPLNGDVEAQGEEEEERDGNKNNNEEDSSGSEEEKKDKPTAEDDPSDAPNEPPAEEEEVEEDDDEPEAPTKEE